jgi:hypothetical protein
MALHFFWEALEAYADDFRKQCEAIILLDELLQSGVLFQVHERNVPKAEDIVRDCFLRLHTLKPMLLTERRSVPGTGQDI